MLIGLEACPQQTIKNQTISEKNKSLSNSLNLIYLMY